MSIPAIWRRPDLVLPCPFDTIFFDVDGVLIETMHSFRAATIATIEYIVHTLYGLDQERSLITLEDIGAFKRAGGFNGDWDMCYLLAALALARVREWHGTALAERSTLEWAALAHEAALQGHGGRVWAESVLPVSSFTDYATVVDIFNENYWGVAELRKRFGREPRYLLESKGYVHNEKLLYAPDFFASLRQAGIAHFGMITGRIGPEVEMALERMEAYGSGRWWDVVVPADMYAKPDPQALRYAIAQVGAQGGLYIGDTADDFDLVRRYKAVKSATETTILAAMVVHGADIELYQQRGADVIVPAVESLRDLDFQTIQV